MPSIYTIEGASAPRAARSKRLTKAQKTTLKKALRACKRRARSAGGLERCLRDELDL
jgi:hypothetical protein